MSNYETDHNISAASRESSSSTTLASSQRHLPTLTQSIASFLENSDSNTESQTEIISALRNTLENSELDEDLRENFLQTLNSNNAVADIFATMGANISDSDATTTRGIDDSFLDTLERIPIKELKKSETCPICTNDYHSDPYPLIVRLPCNDKHFFDLDCIGPWLKLNKTCPLCRVDVTVKKPLEIPPDSEEEEEDWEMYG